MPSNFPTALDNFSNPAATDSQNGGARTHSQQHTDLNDAVEALQAALGTAGSTGTPMGLRTDLATDAPGKGAELVKVDATYNLKTWIAALVTAVGARWVGFVQAGTGAELRTLESKARDQLTAFDFMTQAQRDDTQLVTPELDHTAALQKFFDAQSISLVKDSACARIPAGNYNITAELVAQFNGTLHGDGVECTRLILGTATQNGIRVPYSGTLDIHGLHIQTKSGVTKTAGAGIKIEGISSTSSASQTRVTKCKIDKQYIGIDFANAGFWSVRDTIISDPTIGIRSDNTQNFDSGDNIIGEGTVIYRTSSDATAGTYGILHVASGGLKINKIKVLGFDQGYRLVPRAGATYVIDTQITGSSFEYNNICINLETNTASTSIAQFTITGNQLHPRVNGIVMRGSVSGGTVFGNQLNLQFADVCGIRWATDGTNYPANVNAVGNQIVGNSSAGSIGIHGGFAPKANNNAISANLVSGAATEVVGFLGRQHDVTYTFANLPSDATNGSQVYCSDGTRATPVAGGGTGCIASRVNGQWVGN